MKYRLVVLVILGLCGSALHAQVEQGAKKDTVVIVQRDTVVVMRKDTVYYQQVEPPADQSRNDPNQRNERDRYIEDQRRSRLELREQRLREYEEWVAAQPERRTPGITQAFKFFPTQLLIVDFPAIGFGYERTWNGRYALEGQFGFVTRPFRVTEWGGFTPGEARFGVRGIRAAVGARMYFGEAYKQFPFYLGSEFAYAITPIEFDTWVPSEDGTFEQFVAAPVNGHSTSLAAICGWELRTDEGLTIDFSTGLLVGVKGLRSSNAAVRRSIEERHWNLRRDARTIFGGLVARIGIGFGHWSAVDGKDQSRNKRKSSNRGRKRRGR